MRQSKVDASYPDTDAAILVVDDEEEILHAFRRILVDVPYDLLTAKDATGAIDLLHRHGVGVIIADERMPGMSGTELLATTKSISPATVKILLTAYADSGTAVRGINIGGAFHFISKPWKNEDVVKMVLESLNRYRVISLLRQKDDLLLRALAEDIELKAPCARKHYERVAEYALAIAGKLNLSMPTEKAIEQGAWLHDCGMIDVPEAILNFPGALTPEEFEVVKVHPLVGARVAREAELPEPVVEIIRNHHERFDGSGYPEGRMGTDIPLGARIVAVADVFDALVSERPYRKAFSREDAVTIMKEMKGAFDPEILALFLSLLP